MTHLLAFALGFLAHRLVTRWWRWEQGAVVPYEYGGAIGAQPMDPETWARIMTAPERGSGGSDVSLSEYPAAYLRQKGGDAG